MQFPHAINALTKEGTHGAMTRPQVFAEVIDIERRKNWKRVTNKFCQKWRRVKKKGNKEFGILAGTNDWEMKADINGRLGFPEEILVTNKRPDIVVWSKSKKAVIMIELTIALEERIENVY
jgi:hypothetical protein